VVSVLRVFLCTLNNATPVISCLHFVSCLVRALFLLDITRNCGNVMWTRCPDGFRFHLSIKWNSTTCVCVCVCVWTILGGYAVGIFQITVIQFEFYLLTQNFCGSISIFLHKCPPWYILLALFIIKSFQLWFSIAVQALKLQPHVQKRIYSKISVVFPLTVQKETLNTHVLPSANRQLSC